MGGRIVVIVCAGCVALLAACAPATTETEPEATIPLADSVVVSLTPRDGVRYYESGIQSSADTSVAIGILRYRADNKTEGSWLLTSREDTAVLAADVVPFAKLAGEPGFDVDLWPLDGQYVAAEGSAMDSTGDVVTFDVESLSLVADIFPTESNIYTVPGIYHLPNGQPFVLAWVGDTVNGTTTLQDRSPDADGEPIVIATIPKAGKGPPVGVFFHANCEVTSDEPAPSIRITDGDGYSPDDSGELHIGMPAEWQYVERAGIKDLPDGRTRVVGSLIGGGQAGNDPTELSIGVSEPWPMTITHYRWTLELDDPDSTIDVSADELIGPLYVAVEGVLSADASVLTVESFERISVP